MSKREYRIDPETDTLYVYSPSGDYTYSMIGLRFKGTATASMLSVNGDHFTFDICIFGNYSGRYAVITLEVDNFTM